MFVGSTHACTLEKKKNSCFKCQINGSSHFQKHLSNLALVLPSKSCHFSTFKGELLGIGGMKNNWDERSRMVKCGIQSTNIPITPTHRDYQTKLGWALRKFWFVLQSAHLPSVNHCILRMFRRNTPTARPKWSLSCFAQMYICRRQINMGTIKCILRKRMNRKPNESFYRGSRTGWKLADRLWSSRLDQRQEYANEKWGSDLSGSNLSKIVGRSYLALWRHTADEYCNQHITFAVHFNCAHENRKFIEICILYSYTTIDRSASAVQSSRP